MTSPVIATSRRTGRPLSALAIASVSVMPALGPSFGIAPAGRWMCRSLSRNTLSSMPSCLRARPHVRVRGVDRLAHHVAELSGDRQAARCPACERFDQHDVAAGRRPRETRDDADLGHLLGFLGRVARNAEHFLDLVDVDDPRAFFAVRLARARACA